MCGICILPIVIIVVVVAFTVALWNMLQNTAECVVAGRRGGGGKEGCESFAVCCES